MSETVASARTALRLDSEKLRFVLVGAWNTLFGYGLFAALERTLGQETHYLVALVVAHVIATLTAFFLHRHWTFKVQGGSLLGDLVRFWSVYAGLLAVNAVMLPLLVEVVGIHVLIAQALFVVVTVVSSYFGHKYFSFRRA
jgi:putative flippase GtrA